MRVRLVPAWSAASTGVLLSACSLVGLDGFSDGIVAGPDAAPDTSVTSASDAGTDGFAPFAPTDSGDGDVDSASSDGGECAPTANNLLASQNPDFEDGCALWTAGRAGLSSTTSARCGKAACRICPTYDQDQNGYASRTVFGVTPLPGERYVFTAWLRREDGSSNIEGRVALGGDNASVTYGSTPLMSAWGKSVAVYEVTADDTSTELRLLLDNRKTGGNECIVFDDASLVRVRDAGQ